MRAIVEEWPQAPKTAAEKLLEHYGSPNEATPTKLFWYGVGPWSRIEVTANEGVHNFPTPHRLPHPVRRLPGAVEQGERAGRVRRQRHPRPHCRADRCARDHEAYNTLTLNLAVEIINGRCTVDDARRLYGETAAAYSMGRDAPYAERLLFEPLSGTADPDEAVIATSIGKELVEKVKDVFGAGDPPR